MCITTSRRQAPRRVFALLLVLVAYVLGYAAMPSAASAPVFSSDEVHFVLVNTAGNATRAFQTATCATDGGVLATDVSSAVHTKLLEAMASTTIGTYYGYLGGSTTLATGCSTTAASLECVWYWDVGRYAGTANALAFYRGNYASTSSAASSATEAGPLNGLPNFWATVDGVSYPSTAYGQFIMLNKVKSTVSAMWFDSGDKTFSYAVTSAVKYWAMCQLLSSSSSSSSNSTGTVTTSSSSFKPLWIGIIVAVGVVAISCLVGLLVWLIISCGCCGSRGAAESAEEGEALQPARRRSSSRRSSAAMMEEEEAYVNEADDGAESETDTESIPPSTRHKTPAMGTAAAPLLQNASFGSSLRDKPSATASPVPHPLSNASFGSSLRDRPPAVVAAPTPAPMPMPGALVQSASAGSISRRAPSLRGGNPLLQPQNFVPAAVPSMPGNVVPGPSLLQNSSFSSSMRDRPPIGTTMPLSLQPNLAAGAAAPAPRRTSQPVVQPPPFMQPQPMPPATISPAQPRCASAMPPSKQQPHESHPPPRVNTFFAGPPAGYAATPQPNSHGPSLSPGAENPFSSIPWVGSGQTPESTPATVPPPAASWSGSDPKMASSAAPPSQSSTPEPVTRPPRRLGSSVNFVDLAQEQQTPTCADSKLRKRTSNVSFLV